MKKIELFVLPVALSFAVFFSNQSGNPELFFKLVFITVGIYNHLVGLYYIFRFFNSDRNMEFLNIGLVRLLLGVGMQLIPVLMSWFLSV